MHKFNRRELMLGGTALGSVGALRDAEQAQVIGVGDGEAALAGQDRADLVTVAARGRGQQALA